MAKNEGPVYCPWTKSQEYLASLRSDEWHHLFDMASN